MRIEAVDEIWNSAWRQALKDISGPVLDPPLAEATQAFELLSQLRNLEVPAWNLAITPTEIAADCAAVASLLPQGGRGFVKAIYFTTRGLQVERVLISILYMTILARINNYHGPIAWVSFPVVLLDENAVKMIRNLFSRIEDIKDKRVAYPIELDFESTAPSTKNIEHKLPTIFIGANRPYELHGLHQTTDAYEVRHGLPFICIPGRTTEQLTVAMGAW